MLLVLVISLSPFALNGMWFDDSNLSSFFWELKVTEVSIFQYIWNQILVWMYSAGRFFPIGLLQTYGLHYIIRNEHLFRFGHVLWTLVHIGTFIWLLRKLKLDWNFIGLWLLILIGIFQARNYHDPIASYGFFLQTQGIFLTLAIVSLLKWSESARNKWLIASSTLVLIALLMYEINLVFYPIAFGLLLMAPHPIQLKIRALITLFIPLISYSFFTAYLRNAIDISYPGVKVGSADLIFITYCKQFLAAFPGVFYLLQWKAEFPIVKLLFVYIYIAHWPRF